MTHKIFTSILCLLLPLFAIAQDDDCRVKREDLQPVIQRFNPFFANHTWDKQGQIEMAKMGEDRILVITQDGCKRHHIRFYLMIEASDIEPDLSFWIRETENLLHKIYWDNPDYLRFGREFNEVFSEKIKAYGFDNPFNFPLGSRNFICEINKDPKRGGKIMIEMVTFIFEEKVQTLDKGIPSKEDDGWRQ